MTIVSQLVFDLPRPKRHAAALVRRDRNHPSVIARSIGNEILNQPQDPEGKSRERIAYLLDRVLRHVASRPVGLGCLLPSTAATDTLADLDLTGWNYQQRYVPMRAHWLG